MWMRNINVNVNVWWENCEIAWCMFTNNAVLVEELEEVNKRLEQQFDINTISIADHIKWKILGSNEASNVVTLVMGNEQNN